MNHKDRLGMFQCTHVDFSCILTTRIKRFWISLICVTMVFFTLPKFTLGESQGKEPTLVHAVMCEAIENYLPVYPAVVFSIAQGEIICFTSFDPVPEETRVFHKWYKKDRLISMSRLILKPPKWSSFSSMQLRNLDKGPWRVDVENATGTVLQTLRFSISD